MRTTISVLSLMLLITACGGSEAVEPSGAQQAADQAPAASQGSAGAQAMAAAVSGTDDPAPSFGAAGEATALGSWSIEVDPPQDGTLRWRYRNDSAIEASFSPATSFFVAGKEFTPSLGETRKQSKAVGPDPFMQPVVPPGVWQEQVYVYPVPGGHSGDAYFVVWTTATERAPETGRTYEVVQARSVIDLGAMGG